MPQCKNTPQEMTVRQSIDFSLPLYYKLQTDHRTEAVIITDYGVVSVLVDTDNNYIKQNRLNAIYIAQFIQSYRKITTTANFY